MPKITFMGAGSTVFAKNVLGDSLLTPALMESEIALYDVDKTRLEESRLMLESLNRNCNRSRARITAHLGKPMRLRALRGADFVINAIQVGGYKPSTVIDFEIPKRYGLRQTIADTLGIGGIFRALRTIPVMLDFCRDMEKACPGAWLLNYSNPMAMAMGAVLRGSGVKGVGLCHSVQVCAEWLLRPLDMWEGGRGVRWKIAGINHMGWLLELSRDGKDLYPEVKRRAAKINAAARKKKGEKHGDMVRYEIMRHFGYYVTESSEHSAEYMPYFIKRLYPGLVKELNIPLDEYPRRCVEQIKGWKEQKKQIVHNHALGHERTHEYGSYIMESIVTGVPCSIGGNVLNRGLITNLPSQAVVEVPCLVDKNGVQGCLVGDLPEPCAALNRTNVNVQLLTVEAALTLRRERVYQAAMLDPHLSSELSLDDIKSLCDDLFAAHGPMLPSYR